MSIVALSETPILSFLNNAGQLNAGGSLLTQVGGVNYPTYQDPNGSTPLPNPIPLNSRGEISNAAGTSCQLFLVSGVTYDFTLFDANGNQLWTASNVMAIAPVAVGNMTDEKGSGGNFGFVAGVDFTAGTTTTLTLSQNYGSASNLWVAFDGVEQGADTYTLSGTTLTFNAPIPVGTNKVYVKGGTTLSIGTPGIGTITDVNVASNAGINASKLSFLQNGGGAVVRTVLSKLQDTVSVLDFGAVGVAPGTTPTVDATAAFQLAVNSGALTVEVPNLAFLIAGQITMPQGVKLIGKSGRGSIIPTNTQSQFGYGSFLYITNLTQSPFLYSLGNAFVGLTFYYPNQLRTLSTPIVYPATFTFNPALSSTVIFDVLWQDIQFINSYEGINARCGHLDFKFNRIQGYCVYNAINIDGGGGSDYLNEINLSYYYFCQQTDPINVWTQANGVILQIGRSDAIDMQQIFVGTGFIALQTYIGSVNSVWGPYGTIRGLSLDSCANGIVSYSTHFIGITVEAMMANSQQVDFQIGAAEGTYSRWQFTGFKTWGPRTESFLVGQAGSSLRLTSGEIQNGYTGDAVRCIVSGPDLHIDNVEMLGAAPSVVTSGFTLNSLLVKGCYLAAAPSLGLANTQIVTDNPNFNDQWTTVATAATISVANIGDNVFLSGTTTISTINGGWKGRRVLFIAGGGSTTFATGGNIMATTAGLTIVQNGGLELVFDGTNWRPTQN